MVKVAERKVFVWERERARSRKKVRKKKGEKKVKQE